MANETHLQDLLGYLKDCNIPHNTKDIREAFNSGHGSTMASWVKEYLSTETLLTKDELTMYSVLQKSGEWEALAASLDSPHIHPHSDKEIQDAIEQLKKSTMTIEKQTETLKTQQEAMASLVKSNKQNAESRASCDNIQYRSWSMENAQVSNKIDELIQTLNYRISELENHRKEADANLNQTAGEILKADDKLLLSLQKLSGGLQPEQSDGDVGEQEIRDLCARLIKYTVEGVRARLDVVFLEASRSSNTIDHEPNSNDPEVIALQEELESLYSEILPVAQMSVEKQFLQPALRAISSRDTNGKHRSCKGLDYISSCLSFLIDRLHAFTKHAEEYQNHRMAILHLTGNIKNELSITAAQVPPKTKTGSPPLSQRPKSISQARSRPARRSSCTTSFEEDMAPEQIMLKNLGISLPENLTSDSQISEALLEILDDRSKKLGGHTRNLQEAEETTIAASLHDAHLTLQGLRNSILSETRYNNVHLADEEVEEAIALMEAEVEGLREELGAVDVEKLRERNLNRDNFIERWAR